MIAVYSTGLRDRFRNLDRRDGVLLRGPAGWGEFSPFWDYDDVTCVPWLRAAVEAATLPYPTPVRERVAVNATVPAVGPVRAAEIVASSGCTTVKVKVAQAGQSLGEDLDRVAAVRDALGPSGQVRVDANAAWSLEDAVRAVPALDRAAGGLQYAEQPVAGVDDLARLRRRVSVPIAADESIRRASDPLAVKRAEAADVVVIKVQPLGGVRACLALVAELGLPMVVSSALESSVGIAAGVALAAALPGIELASGLATVTMFEQDVAATPLVPEAGSLPGGRVAPTALTHAPDAVAARWLERLHRVADVGGIDLDEVLA
ncbi:o-succinylbenzoate synthase [Propioniciclava flava]|uniref:o-succinylbenzoate synthase n=1 Tax=Propioniciclava flava TaxID=2072026 RepID=A0A4Q2EJZ2_9ACTN|nr:o-succinylbenzoate synthase [Propioniciclava flava]RXW33032.1 O-succinylbenzoate synthase [Propioniciclava flava]